MQLVDAERATRDWLAARFPLARLCTETPADLEAHLPCIRVTRIGGSDSDSGVLDDCLIDVEVFGPDRPGARVSAEEVRAALRWEMPGDLVAGGAAAVQYVRTSVAPRWIPYDNTDVRRFVATYLIRLHTL